MSKQDIEKRLGFAAQGMKAEMAIGSYKQGDRTVTVNGKKYEVLPYQMDFFIKELATLDTPEWRADVVKEYLRRGYIKATAARPGVKAKMALTISTVGAKNLCYEALANLGELAKLASDTKSGWGFHVTVMTDHVKSAMSQLESSPAQAGTHLERAINTLGMLRKIDPVRLNDIQKGSLKQLIGYVAKSLRDARANIKVVTTASRPGVKAKFDLTGMELYNRIVPTINILGRFWGVQAPRFKQNIADAAKYAKKAFDLGEKIFQSNTASPQEIREFERQVSVAKAQPGWRIANSENFSRPGAKAKFEKEYVLWGLPKGETDAIHQQVLSTQAKTPAQMEDVKKRAAAAGWHSFRVQILDLSKPYKGFARPGVKAKMGSSQVNDSATTADLIREAQRLRDVIKTSNREFDKTHLRQIKQELDKRGVLMPYGASEVLASRPGVKAKFELRAQKIMGDGRVYLDLKKAKEWLSSENNKALEQIISSAKANSDKESRGGVDGPKFNYYADLAMMAQEILKSNKREGRMQASLPGAKAKA